MAGAVLVPEAALDNELNLEPQPLDETERLAKRFSVSREVILRKFLERGLVVAAEYNAAAQEWAAQTGTSRKRGGNFYRTKIAYLGDEYITLVLRRYYEGHFEAEELAEYLDTKIGNIDRLEETFFGERG